MEFEECCDVLPSYLKTNITPVALIVLHDLLNMSNPSRDVGRFFRCFFIHSVMPVGPSL